MEYFDYPSRFDIPHGEQIYPGSYAVPINWPENALRNIMNKRETGLPRSYVALGRRRDLNWPGAIKVYEPTDDTEKRELIENEIEIMSRLLHHNIARIRLRGQIPVGKNPTMICDFIGLQELSPVEPKEMTIDEKITAIGQVASALDYCLRKEILPNDVEIANIGRDRNNRIKLFDFGIAIDLRNNKIKYVCGTEIYMAPEKVNKLVIGDMATQMHELGLLAYELLGGNPQEAWIGGPSSVHCYQEQILHKPTSISYEQHQLISTATAYDPEERLESFPTYSDFAIALRKVTRIPKKTEDFRPARSSSTRPVVLA